MSGNQNLQVAPCTGGMIQRFCNLVAASSGEDSCHVHDSLCCPTTDLHRHVNNRDDCLACLHRRSDSELMDGGEVSEDGESSEDGAGMAELTLCLG